MLPPCLYYCGIISLPLLWRSCLKAQGQPLLSLSVMPMLLFPEHSLGLSCGRVNWWVFWFYMLYPLQLSSSLSLLIPNFTPSVAVLTSLLHILWPTAFFKLLWTILITWQLSQGPCQLSLVSQENDPILITSSSSNVRFNFFPLWLSLRILRMQSPFVFSCLLSVHIGYVLWLL